MAQRWSTGYTPSAAPSTVGMCSRCCAQRTWRCPSSTFRLSRVGKAAAARPAKRGQLTKNARTLETSVEVGQEGFPREPGSAGEATPSCDGPADESNGGSSSPDSSSSSSCRSSSSSSHISCNITSSKRSSNSASDGKSEHRGEYCKGFKLSQTFAKGQHVGYEATCYLHMAGDGWACRRTCIFVKNNNPERRRP